LIISALLTAATNASAEEDDGDHEEDEEDEEWVGEGTLDKLASIECDPVKKEKRFKHCEKFK
jgi:hypothetical protein